MKGTVGTDGVLTFGIKVANANFNWVSFKNFKLQYLGAASIEQLQATLQEKIEEAKAYAENCPKGIAAIVNAAITQGDNAQPTEESLNAAIAALTKPLRWQKKQHRQPKHSKPSWQPAKAMPATQAQKKV